MKRIIISFGTQPSHRKGLARLHTSLYSVQATMDQWLFDTYPDGCPRHKDVPYGFKAWALQLARRTDYDMAIWLDSCVWANRPIDGAWDEIATVGHLVILDGWNCGQWSTDAALKSFNVTREQAWEIPLIMAGVLGLDFRNERSCRFLDEWERLSLDGVTFPGPWVFPEWEGRTIRYDKRAIYGHRHDQAAASLLLHKLDMPINNDPRRWCHYAPDGPTESIFCVGGKRVL